MTYDEWKLDNWDRAHRETDLTALTGTGIGGHLIALGAVELAHAETVVLCIGVGTGVWVKEMHQRVKEVWSLDCSPFAEIRVHDVSKFVVDPKNLPSDYFDLALSLWVAPHMNDRDLEEQLLEVIRSLKKGGVLGMHYKEPLNLDDVVDNKPGQPEESEIARAAGMLRQRDYLRQMVDRCGGRISKIVAEYPSDVYQMTEVMVQITPI